MLLESLLAYAHIIAILGLVTFLTSEAALCRADWMNAAVVDRLLRVDRLYLVAAITVLATGLARTYWGVKGFGWYWSQPLLHVKVGLFVAIGLLSAMPTRAFFRWKRTLAASGTLPAAEDVKRARRWIMIEAHALLLVPLAGTLLARGVGTR
jgi:putative membrane protein